MSRARVAAIQIEAAIADVDANLAACERLADQAGAAGARWIALPEFFTTGIGFVPELVDCALPPDGSATELLRELAARHDARVGGSFLCRDRDGEVRNAFLLATPEGIVGRHDKDLPTMWENSFYVGGFDDGVIDVDGTSVGAVLCWELMRTQTVRRLRGRVDLILGGSGWWSIPPWPPAAITRRMEAANARTAATAPAAIAPLVGAPVVHGAHAGLLECRMPWAPLRYRGHFEGGAQVCDSAGRVLAGRSWHDGEGIAVAEVELGRAVPAATPPERFWLHRRGPIPALAWSYQRLHGRRWYRRHARRALGARRQPAESVPA